jgi:hypothetical protein
MRRSRVAPSIRSSSEEAVSCLFRSSGGDLLKGQALMDSHDFIEVSDLARLLYVSYSSTARKRDRERQNIDFARNAGVNPLEDVAHKAYTEWDKVCDQYARHLWQLADLVAKRLPKVYEDLRLVSQCAKWHTEREFNWEAAEKELRRIEAAALQAAEALSTGKRAMFPCLFRFVDRSLWERDLLRQAVADDKRDHDLQTNLKAFRDGSGLREGEVSYSPIGRTEQLLRTIDPQVGYGELDKAYQEATAEAIGSGLGSYLLPKLEAAYRAHRDLCSQAMATAERSGRVEDLTCFDAHCETFNALINLVNSQATKPEAAPAVEDQAGKVKRGTKKTKTRKIDVAITLVVRNPELDDAEIARRAHCDRSYLTKNKDYQQNAAMARRAMARLPAQQRAEYDARSGQAHPTTTDPKVDC